MHIQIGVQHVRCVLHAFVCGYSACAMGWYMVSPFFFVS